MPNMSKKSMLIYRYKESIMPEHITEGTEEPFTSSIAELLKPDSIEVTRYSDTELDVEGTKADVARFKAGEVVQSQRVVAIAKIDGDYAALLEESAKNDYSNGNTIGRISQAPGDDGVSIDLSPTLTELLSAENQEKLNQLIETFLREVKHDAQHNNLGQGASGPIRAYVRVGAFDRNDTEMYVHTDPCAVPAVKYIAAFGVAGTGTIEEPVQAKRLDNPTYNRVASPDELTAQGATYVETATIGRFVQDRDAHFAPAGSGPRIFLEAVVDL